jgi:hypothetical protein
MRSVGEGRVGALQRERMDDPSGPLLNPPASQAIGFTHRKNRLYIKALQFAQLGKNWTFRLGAAFEMTHLFLSVGVAG